MFLAAAAQVDTDPEAFPIEERVGVIVASAKPFAEPDGYTIATAIEEVLVDAGLLADERLVAWEEHEIRPEMATNYSVQVEGDNG